jgi:hypothetical protein
MQQGDVSHYAKIYDASQASVRYGCEIYNFADS